MPEGGPPELTGRPLEAVGNGGPRWMTADRSPSRRPATEPGVQADSPVPPVRSGRSCLWAALFLCRLMSILGVRFPA